MTVLEIDVGNTRLKWRLRTGQLTSARGALVRSEFASLAGLLAALSVELQVVGHNPPAQVLVATVAAAEIAAGVALWARHEYALEAEFAYVSARSSNGVLAGYEEPERLGVDRWLAVLASSARGLDGAVIVDCGSAITLDILRGNTHLGGYIVPGLRLMNGALFKDTARVKVAAFEPTDGAPGRNTRDAVNSGLPLMAVGFVHEVLTRLVAAGWWAEGFRAQVLITGGDAALLLPMFMAITGAERFNFELAADLVLDGLALSARRKWLAAQ